MSEIEVRIAKASDLEAARHVIIQTWLNTYVPIHGEAKVHDTISRWHTPDILLQQIENGKQLFGVGLLKSKVVGHVSAYMENVDTLKIGRLYILPDAQGKGIGQRLFDFALSSFEHAQNVSLEVDESNEGAIRFYQRNGLVITDRTDHCGNDSDITALIMSARCENLRMN